MSNSEKTYEFVLKELEKITEKTNFQAQCRKPKLFEIELIGLILYAEIQSIDSEYQLFRKCRK